MKAENMKFGEGFPEVDFVESSGGSTGAETLIRIKEYDNIAIAHDLLRSGGDIIKEKIFVKCERPISDKYFKGKYWERFSDWRVFRESFPKLRFSGFNGENCKVLTCKVPEYRSFEDPEYIECEGTHEEQFHIIAEKTKKMSFSNLSLREQKALKEL